MTPLEYYPKWLFVLVPLAILGLWKIYDLVTLWYMITQMRGGL